MPSVDILEIIFTTSSINVLYKYLNSNTFVFRTKVFTLCWSISTQSQLAYSLQRGEGKKGAVDSLSTLGYVLGCWMELMVMYVWMYDRYIIFVCLIMIYIWNIWSMVCCIYDDDICMIDVCMMMTYRAFSAKISKATICTFHWRHFSFLTRRYLWYIYKAITNCCS